MDESVGRAADATDKRKPAGSFSRDGGGLRPIEAKYSIALLGEASFEQCGTYVGAERAGDVLGSTESFAFSHVCRALAVDHTVHAQTLKIKPWYKDHPESQKAKCMYIATGSYMRYIHGIDTDI